MADEQQTAVVNPDGKLVNLPAGQVNDALQSGYALPDAAQTKELGLRKQYGQGLGNELLAGAAGAARGLTFGLSDQLLTKTGLVKPETLDELQARNKVPSGLGEAAGVAGASLLAPESILGRTAGGAVEGVAGAGRFVEDLVARSIGEGTSTASRVAAKALAKGAGSAVEGAFYGTGQVISEQALGDPDALGEKALAHVGLSAILAGATGGLLGGAAEASAPLVAHGKKALAATLEKMDPKAFLEDMAGKKGLEASGLYKKDYTRLLQDVPGMEGTESEGETTSLLAEAERLAAKYNIAGTDGGIAGALLRPKSVEQIAKDLGGRLDAGREGMAKFSTDIDALATENKLPRFDGVEYAQQLRKQVIEPIADDPMMQNVAHMLSGKADLYEKLGTNVSFTKAEELKRSFNKAFDRTNPDAVNKALQQARGILNSQIEEKARPLAEMIGPDAFKEWKGLKRDYQALNVVQKAAELKALARNPALRDLSPSDNAYGIAAGMTGVMAHGAIGGAYGIGTALAHKYVRENGNAIVADLAGRASRMAGLEVAGKKVTALITKGVDGFIAGVGKGAKLAAPAATAALHETVLGPQENTAKQARGDVSRQDAFKARVKELGDFINNPSAATDRVASATDSLSTVAPQTASAMGVRAVAAARFLWDKAPKNPDDGGIVAGSDKWHPSDASIGKWERYLRAVQDPTSVLTDLQHGRVSTEAVEALKAVYPKMYGEIAATLIPKLADKKDIPLSVRMQLSTMFQTPADSQAKPAFVAQMQAVHQAAVPKTGPAKNPVMTGKSAIINASQTPLQRALGNT